MIADSRIQMATAEVRTIATQAFQLNSLKRFKEDPAKPDELSQEELLAFDRTFRKSLRAAHQTNDHMLAGIFSRHKLEIMLGLLIAKKQIEGIFGGTGDSGSTIGVSYSWEPIFWGLQADDWRGQTPTTAGSPQNMIHSGAAVFGGTAGNDVQFLENVVFVVLGYANYSVDYPRVVKLQERIDTAPQPYLNVGPVWRNSNADYPVKYYELDTPRILKNGSKFRLQTLADETVPASEWVYPIGAMFTRHSLLLDLDIPGKSNLETFLADHGVIAES
jgi:hypothetical protein